MRNPGIGQVIVFALLLYQTFSTLTQYMSMSQGYSTICELECGGGCEAKRRRWSRRLGVSKGYGDAHQ